MSIFRREKSPEKPFTQVSNAIINDDRLTWQARGLLIYILSKPNDWHIFSKDLVNHSPSGRESVNTTINLLIELGYIERYKIRNNKGIYAGYEYLIHEEPIQSGKTVSGSTVYGEPASTNTNLNKDLINKELNNNNDNDNAVSQEKPECFSNSKQSLKDNTEIKEAITIYITDFYPQKTNREHPYLKPSQYRNIYTTIENCWNEWNLNKQALLDMMLGFFNSKICTDYNLNHFATEGILQNKMYQHA